MVGQAGFDLRAPIGREGKAWLRRRGRMQQPRFFRSRAALRAEALCRDTQRGKRGKVAKRLCAAKGECSKAAISAAAPQRRSNPSLLFRRLCGNFLKIRGLRLWPPASFPAVYASPGSARKNGGARARDRGPAVLRRPQMARCDGIGGTQSAPLRLSFLKMRPARL